MKIENFELLSDKDIYNNIPNKELNTIVKQIIDKNNYKNFCVYFLLTQYSFLYRLFSNLH